MVRTVQFATDIRPAIFWKGNKNLPYISAEGLSRARVRRVEVGQASPSSSFMGNDQGCVQEYGVGQGTRRQQRWFHSSRKKVTKYEQKSPLLVAIFDHQVELVANNCTQLLYKTILRSLNL